MLLRKIHGNKPSVNHLFLAQRWEESAIFDFRVTSNPTEIASNSSFFHWKWTCSYERFTCRSCLKKRPKALNSNKEHLLWNKSLILKLFWLSFIPDITLPFFLKKPKLSLRGVTDFGISLSLLKLHEKKLYSMQDLLSFLGKSKE